MNSIFGDFHFKEINEKSYLVYQQDNPTNDSSIVDKSFSTLFLCPNARGELIGNAEKERKESGKRSNGLIPLEMDRFIYFKDVIKDEDYHSKDYYERLDPDNHPVLPLFWCNNKNKDEVNDLNIYPDYYFCVKCDQFFPKEAIFYKLKIKHPLHPFHPLVLSYYKNTWDYPDSPRTYIVYHCNLCNISFENISLSKPIPFVIDRSKKHDHTLTLFIRNDCLLCNICGCVVKTRLTYVCLKCNFVAHEDCAYSPNVIRISRHHHSILFVSSLPYGKWKCRVCRCRVDSRYGAYVCEGCEDYVVHLRCALRKDIWDGEELEGKPEEYSIEEMFEPPFDSLIDGRILHFSHDHYVKLETSGEVYDGNKICDACVIPIYEGDFYSCMECDFILHDTCANAPRRKQHPLYPHPLTLKVLNGYIDGGYLRCTACKMLSSGFFYEYKLRNTCFVLDMRCASIYEPFDYQGHKHPLFLAIDPEQKRLSCQVCNSYTKVLINCIECNFIRCFECVTLPYMAKYKHDKHFLELSYWEEVNEADWCEICERIIFSERDNDKRFYRCKHCCTTLHLKCLFGEERYVKSGHAIKSRGMEIEILPNNSFSRPTCDYCYNRCVDKNIFRRNNNTFCSPYHADNFFM